MDETNPSIWGHVLNAKNQTNKQMSSLANEKINEQMDE